MRIFRFMLSMLLALTFLTTLPVLVRYVWKPRKSMPFFSGKICVFPFRRRPSGLMYASIRLRIYRSSSLSLLMM